GAGGGAGGAVGGGVGGARRGEGGEGRRLPRPLRHGEACRNRHGTDPALGYLMKKFDYEPMPLVLAYVLGRMAEETIRQTLLVSRGSAAIFLERPLLAIFLSAALALVPVPLLL